MKVAKSSAYAICSLVYLAQRPEPGEPVLLRDIASSCGLPKPFISKVFQRMTPWNIVQAHRGRKRGYSLAQRPEQISLYDIVLAAEGPGLFRTAVPDGLPRGAEGLVRSAWEEIDGNVVRTLKELTLRHLVNGGSKNRRKEG